MTPLAGLGLWIWEWHACEGGDAEAMLARAASCGVRWVAIKAGEDGTPNGQVTAARVNALRAGGVEVAAWWYSRPEELEGQASLLGSLVRAGVRHFVMDAEAEWDAPDRRPLAKAFAERLRLAVGPDVFLADAPWARPLSHKAPFPYAEFGAVMDARMPQFYWELAAPEPAPHFFATADREWVETDPRAAVCPALSPVSYDGTKHAPVSELAMALDRYQDRPAVSIWSWQHLSPAEWALLAQRARAAAPVDVTAGGEDRPVFVNPPPEDEE